MCLPDLGFQASGTEDDVLLLVLPEKPTAGEADSWREGQTEATDEVRKPAKRE